MIGRRRTRTSAVVVEVRRDLIRVARDDRVVETRLRRDAAGGLEEASRAEVLALLSKLAGDGRAIVTCGLPASGVSLRAFDLPDVGAEERERMLALRLEAELPVALDDLAWGHAVVESGTALEPGSLRVVVAAVREESLLWLRSLLAEARVKARWTATILAMHRVVSLSSPKGAIVAVDAADVEILAIRDGAPCYLRSIRRSAGSATDDLGRVVAALQEGLAIAGGAEDSTRVVIVSRGDPRDPALERLEAMAAARWGSDRVRTVVEGPKPDESPALRGLAVGGAIELRRRGSAEKGDSRRSARRTAVSGARFWALVAVVLALASLALRYAAPFARARRLEERLVAARTERELVPTRDDELGFLEALASTRVPHLEAAAVIARVAPAGTQIETFSVDERGEISFDGLVPKPDLLHAFRASLSTSGWLEDVVLLEQSVSRDKKRKGVLFRFSARLVPTVSVETAMPPWVSGAPPAPQPGAAAPTPPANEPLPDGSAPGGAAPSPAPEVSASPTPHPNASSGGAVAVPSPPAPSPPTRPTPSGPAPGDIIIEPSSEVIEIDAATLEAFESGSVSGGIEVRIRR